MKLKEGVSIDITEVRWRSGYRLEISFSDGFSHSVDFEPFLSESMQPEVRNYLDAEKFKAFSISFGNLIWNDYDMCFSVEDLYAGCISPFEPLQSKVAEDEPEYKIERKEND